MLAYRELAPPPALARERADPAGRLLRGNLGAFDVTGIRFRVGGADGLEYYDQSHRIHEFRAIAGVTPTDFIREQNVINDAFVGNLQSS